MPERMNTPKADHAPNLKQLLIARNEWFDRGIMNAVRSGPNAYLTPGQARLLARMGGKPTSMAELARRLAISRQAVHKSVSELARRGILEVREDPERGNSKLVVYTDKGRQVNRSGAQIIDRLEQRIAQRIGAAGLAELKTLLAAAWDEPRAGDD